jgi:hypothetical protein
MTFLKTEAGNAGISALQFDRSESPGELQMLQYQESTGKFVFKDPFFIDPADGSWGEVGSAVDSTPAFQAAVNYAIMGDIEDPALAQVPPITTRFAQWPIKISNGTFRLDTKLKVYAAHGLRFEGSGEHTTHLVAGSVGQDHILKINGCGNSTFSEFTLETDHCRDGHELDGC